jgi:hypothetical protein
VICSAHLKNSRFVILLAVTIVGSIVLAACQSNSQKEPHRWQAVPVLIELYTSPGFTPPDFAWNKMPELVVYADGRVIRTQLDYAGSEYQRSVLEAHLASSEICSLLTQIEANGFFDPSAGVYTPPGVTDMGTTFITVKAWQTQQISAYGLDFALDTQYGPAGGIASPALTKTYILLSQFAPANAQPYQPDRVAVLVHPLESSQAAQLWPIADLKLSTLITDTTTGRAEVVLDGDKATQVYQLFADHLSVAFSENGKAYQVSVRPLLPLEIWQGAYSFEMTPTVQLSCGSETK